MYVAINACDIFEPPVMVPKRLSRQGTFTIFLWQACPPHPRPPKTHLHLQPPPAPKKASAAGEGGLAEGLRRLFQGTPKAEKKGVKTITSAPPAARSDVTDPPKPKPKPPQPRRLRVDLVLYSGGRDANSETLGCAAAGVDLARYGRVKASARNRWPRVSWSL